MGGCPGRSPARVRSGGGCRHVAEAADCAGGMGDQAAALRVRPMARKSASRASLSAWAASRSLTAWAMVSNWSKVTPDLRRRSAWSRDLSFVEGHHVAVALRDPSLGVESVSVGNRQGRW